MGHDMYLENLVPSELLGACLVTVRLGQVFFVRFCGPFRKECVCRTCVKTLEGGGPGLDELPFFILALEKRSLFFRCPLWWGHQRNTRELDE